MDEAAVLPPGGIVMVGIVVELRYLVAAVKDRNAALGEHPGVEHQDAVQGQHLFLRRGGALQAAQGSRGAAHAGVAQGRVVVVELTPGADMDFKTEAFSGRAADNLYKMSE